MSAVPARTERIVTLSRQIVELLERNRGKRFTMSTGNTGPEWQNVCKLDRELALLQERQKISYAAPPESAYWIEPPRDEVRV